MIALVNRTDCPLPTVAGTLNHLLDLECPLCHKVTYQLWLSPADGLGPADERQLHTYLFQTVIESHPKHRDFYLMPDDAIGP